MGLKPGYLLKSFLLLCTLMKVARRNEEVCSNVKFVRFFFTPTTLVLLLIIVLAFNDPCATKAWALRHTQHKQASRQTDRRLGRKFDSTADAVTCPKLMPCLLKVSKSRKHFMVSSIFPKSGQKKFDRLIVSTLFHIFAMSAIK